MPARIKLVISDFHLGKGPYREDGSVNVLEDFREDAKFVEFLDYHASEYAQDDVELVINGDFFNLLSIDLDGRLMDAITERVAVEKTEAVLRGHPTVFDALSRFASSPKRSIVFMMGNHDPGFLFEGVRNVVSRRVGGRHSYLLDSYDFDGIHVEHGMQHEPLNAFDPARYFKERNGEVFLNLPFGSRYVIHVLNEEKAKRPYLDKVAPVHRYWRWALVNEPAFIARMIGRSLGFAAAAALKKIPHLELPAPELARRILKYSVYPTLESEAKRLLARRRYHTVIMGHTHVPLYREYGRDKVYLNTGTWNVMTSLDMGNLGRFEALTYAFVEYVDGRPRARLREWRGLYRPVSDVFY